MTASQSSAKSADATKRRARLHASHLLDEKPASLLASDEMRLTKHRIILQFIDSMLRKARCRRLWLPPKIGRLEQESRGTRTGFLKNGGSRWAAMSQWSTPCILSSPVVPRSAVTRRSASSEGAQRTSHTFRILRTRPVTWMCPRWRQPTALGPLRCSSEDTSAVSTWTTKE